MWNLFWGQLIANQQLILKYLTLISLLMKYSQNVAPVQMQWTETCTFAYRALRRHSVWHWGCVREGTVSPWEGDLGDCASSANLFFPKLILVFLSFIYKCAFLPSPQEAPRGMCQSPSLILSALLFCFSHPCKKQHVFVHDYNFSPIFPMHLTLSPTMRQGNICNNVWIGFTYSPVC